MAQDEYRANQTFRTAFDAAYAAPSFLKRVYDRLPKRLLVVASATFILLAGLALITMDTLQKLDEGKQPPLITRIVAPYGLSDRYLPPVDTLTIAPRPIPHIDTELFAQEREYQRSISDTVTWESIMEYVYPDINQDFFIVLPVLEGYDRGFIYTTPVHPAVNCLIENYSQTYVEEFTCEEGPISQFIETADYMYDVPIPEPEVVVVEPTAAPTVDPEATVEPGEEVVEEAPPVEEVVEEVEIEIEPIPPGRANARVLAAQYETPQAAADALKQVFNISRTNGTIGNFAVVDQLNVNYFYAFYGGWHTFVWSHERWVFAVTAETFLRVEEIVIQLPF